MEAGIIAQAGACGAVTISTNMAGRGTDIRLGEGAAAVGGLYVIGTQKHESRRIDNQLRGRAGRQGDPGCSRFFVSLEDDLLVKYRELNPKLGQDLDTIQRLVEGQNLDQRLFLQTYELPVEGQRHRIHTFRQEVLEGKTGYASDLERLVTLRTIDSLWSDYLARLAEFRSGLPWLSWGLAGLPWLTLDRRDAQYEYAQQIHQEFRELEAEMPAQIALAIGGSSGHRAPIPETEARCGPISRRISHSALGPRGSHRGYGRGSDLMMVRFEASVRPWSKLPLHSLQFGQAGQPTASSICTKSRRSASGMRSR